MFNFYIYEIYNARYKMVGVYPEISFLRFSFFWWGSDGYTHKFVSIVNSS